MQDVFLHFLKFFWGENVGFSMPISSVYLTLFLVFVFRVVQASQFFNFREFFLFTTTQKKNAAVLYVETPTFKIAWCRHKIMAWEILLHGEICRYWLFFMFNAMKPTFFVKILSCCDIILKSANRRHFVTNFDRFYQWFVGCFAVNVKFRQRLPHPLHLNCTP